MERSQDYWDGYGDGYGDGLKDQSGADVLQAVLDAIKGTLDPHTQIADHPNVKFAQMQRLKWLSQEPGAVTGAVSAVDPSAEIPGKS